LDCQCGRETVGGAITGGPLTLFPADAGTPYINRYSGQWRTRNVAKRPGGYRGRATEEAQWPQTAGLGIAVSDTAGQSVNDNGG